MGYCGGRTCRPAVDAVLEALTGEKPGHDIPLKVQPPIRPVSLSVLGGRIAMNNNRITDHPVLGKLENQTPVTFTFDGKTYEGFEGDTIASALLANGIRQLRVHEETGAPRAIYCNIGHCFECRVTVDEAQAFAHV